MQIFFVRSGKIGSKIIRYGTEEDSSHVAIGFEGDSLIYHAYSHEIKKQDHHDFWSTYKLVEMVEIRFSPADEAKIRSLFVRSIFHQGYDWSSIVYFAWDRVKVKFLKKKPSTKNKLNSEQHLICTELVYVLDESCFKVTGKYLLPHDIDLAITTPGQLNKILRERFA